MSGEAQESGDGAYRAENNLLVPLKLPSILSIPRAEWSACLAGLMAWVAGCQQLRRADPRHYLVGHLVGFRSLAAVLVGSTSLPHHHSHLLGALLKRGAITVPLWVEGAWGRGWRLEAAAGARPARPCQKSAGYRICPTDLGVSPEWTRPGPVRASRCAHFPVDLRPLPVGCACNPAGALDELT